MTGRNANCSTETDFPMSLTQLHSDPASLKHRCRLALTWAVPVGTAHFCYWLYLLQRGADGKALIDIATAKNLGNATLLMIIAFTATAVIAFLSSSPRLNRREVIGTLIAALGFAALPLIIVLDQAFYMNPEDVYLDRETGMPHLGEVFILCYPWIFLISFPAAILILVALIQDRRRKDMWAAREQVS